MMFAYTFSKILDDVVASTAGAGLPGETFGDASLQDFANRSLERAPAQFDTPHTFTLNAVYELPFGPGKPLLAHQPYRRLDARRMAIERNRNLPQRCSLSLRPPPIPWGVFGGSQRPNWNGQSPYTSGPITSRLTNYFNVATFSVPATYTYGDVARLASWLARPPSATLTSPSTAPSASPAFPSPIPRGSIQPPESDSLRFPNTGIGSAAAGVISTISNNPRQMQFALKLIF